MLRIQNAPFFALSFSYIRLFAKMDIMASLHTQPAVLEFVLMLTGEEAQLLARASVYSVCVIGEVLIVRVLLAFARRVSMGRLMGS